ncbi:hypothetical protein UO65_2935 [Actinokineospora spheciospongiae]|uniref:Uncharacterized protein n=1 Tax=Actinokineospora spheciospongiae TaxID=909613 RepID=W7IMX7_9PSEU|nr:hypothetical protein [Actinokineospora spheciospongiae]EWC61748.1 hypothetical protein UO65_2935 [Actinokineospora spheciospongiae]
MTPLARRLAVKFGRLVLDRSSLDSIREDLEAELAAGVDRQLLIDVHMELLRGFQRDGDEEAHDLTAEALDVLTDWVGAHYRI